MEKYKITKSIRFKLEADETTNNKLRPNLPSMNDENLETLIIILEKVEHDLKSLIFAKDKNGDFIKCNDGKHKFFQILKIKYTWMRNYMKLAFYDNRKNNAPKIYYLKDLDYVQTEIHERWLPEWENIIFRLKEAQKKYTNKQKQFEKIRYSEIAQILNQLAKRSNLEFIKSFIDSLVATNLPDIDKLIEKIKKTIVTLSEEITKQQYNFLPYQSNGLVVAAGSFNFHTVNKSPKMLSIERKKLEDDLDTSLIKTIEKIKGEEVSFISETNANLLYTLDINEVSDLSLDKSYYYLKVWKANQKKLFMEVLQKGDIETAKSIKLFKSDENNFNAIKQRIQNIQNLGDKINNTTIETEKKQYKDKLDKIKGEKNVFFDTFQKDPQTLVYKKLCCLFKRIALKRGQIITKIKAIDKEKQIAEQLQYWCVILEKNEHQFLYLIPRDNEDNLKKAKQYINVLQNAKNEDSIKLHYFKSLTLKALRKLCFKETDNSFKGTVKGVHFPKYEQILSEQERINFYQEILKKAKTIDITSFSGIEELCSNHFDTIENFEIELNKICYIKTVYVSDSIEDILKNQFKAISFEIRSQDIDRYFNEKIDKATDTHKNKKHTELWKNFWLSQNEREQYPIRLNPEIRITYRDAKPSRVDKYDEGMLLYDRTKKNRYLHPQYTLITTITENAYDKNFDITFCDTENIKNKIEEFNTKYNKKCKGEWYYGVDRGTKELATLSITKFYYTSDILHNTVNSEKYRNKKIAVEFPKDICVYELNQNKYYFKDAIKHETDTIDHGFGGPIKNISYYLDEIENGKWFKKITGKETAAIDLTTAKVIKDKIILNGDLMTLQKLKMTVAQRQIFELFHNREIDSTARIEKRGKNNLCISFNGKFFKSNRSADENEKGMVIYRLTNDQKQNSKNEESIINELNQYLQELDLNKYTKHEPPIEKINHLRDAISANMIGVISFLNKKYKAKFISLENLDERKKTGEKFIESHFTQSQTSISRRFEWALYRSLQNEMLVPPNLKQTILLRDDFDQFQFGIIKFIKTKGTSSNCPICCVPSGKTDCHLICNSNNCGFSSKDNRMNIDSLTNSDKVAAFNIAKRGFENFIKEGGCND